MNNCDVYKFDCANPGVLKWKFYTFAIGENRIIKISNIKKLNTCRVFELD